MCRLRQMWLIQTGSGKCRCIRNSNPSNAWYQWAISCNHFSAARVFTAAASWHGHWIEFLYIVALISVNVELLRATVNINAEVAEVVNLNGNILKLVNKSFIDPGELWRLPCGESIINMKADEKWCGSSGPCDFVGLYFQFLFWKRQIKQTCIVRALAKTVCCERVHKTNVPKQWGIFQPISTTTKFDAKIIRILSSFFPLIVEFGK